MCSHTRSQNSTRCPHSLTWAYQRINAIGVVLLLVLPLIYSHIVNESIDGNGYDYQNVDPTNSESSSNRESKNINEGSGVVRSFRFHDFEPRSLGEHTWPVLVKGRKIEPDTKMNHNERRDRQVLKGMSSNRKQRGIHLEADGKDLAVNLEFIVPFLRVPVARSIQLTQTAFRKLADLNVNTILLGGGFVIAAALIVAFVKTISAPAFYYEYGYKKAARNFMDDIEFASPSLGDRENVAAKKFLTLEQRLYANNINVTACAQRAICSYFQRATKFVQAGKGSPVERIIDGFANLDAFKGYLNGTAVMDAIDSGRKKDATTCEHTFQSCKWTNMQNKALEITMDYLITSDKPTATATKIVSSSDRIGRASIFSFKPLGSDVDIGLDFEMPFIQVPLKNSKNQNGYSPATVNINTASVITTGLMAGGSMILAKVIRLLSPFEGKSGEKDKESSQADINSKEIENKILNEDPRETKTAKALVNDATNIFDQFKLVYKNGTSKRVETTLSNLFVVIEDTFMTNQIDIGSCVQKYICLMLYESSKSVRQGKATGLQKIIDGVSSFPWLQDAISSYGQLKRAVEASKLGSNTNCISSYPACTWNAPETQLVKFLKTHVSFT